MKMRMLLAAFAAFCLTDLVLVHDAAWMAKHGLGSRFLLNYALSTLFVVALAWLTACLPVRASLRFATGFLALAVPSVAQMAHFRVYNEVIGPLGFDFAQRNKSETFSYFLETADVPVISLAVALLALGVGLFHAAVAPTAAVRDDQKEDAEKRASEPTRSPAPKRVPGRARMGLTIAAAVYVCAALPLGALNWYSIAQFQSGVFAFYATLTEHLSIKNGMFQVERPEVPKWSAESDGALSFNAKAPLAQKFGQKFGQKLEQTWHAGTRTAAGPTGAKGRHPGITPNIIWIMGESAAKPHMQIYGYERATTPGIARLAREGKVAVFNDALAVGNKTMLSVPYTIFGLEGPDPMGRIYKAPSIFNYAKARGMRTALISAQDIRWYHFDKLVVDKSVDVVRAGTDFASHITVRIGADDHKVVEEGVLPFLSAGPEPFFVIFQMAGSHAPYSKHSPDAFKKWLPEETPDSRNAYDNSILYSDHALARLVAHVERNHPDTWIFYTSDHGQDVQGDVESRYHAGYPKPVINVPLWVYAPRDALERIRKNADAPLTHADLFATTLDILGMRAVRAYDGFSLLGKIPEGRIRMVSEYMPTFSNNPHAAWVARDGRIHKIDFARGQVVGADFETVEPLESLDAQVLALLRLRLAGMAAPQGESLGRASRDGRE